MNENAAVANLETPVKDLSSVVNGQHYVQCLGCEMPYDTMNGQLLEEDKFISITESGGYCSPCMSIEAVFRSDDLKVLERLAELDLHRPMPRGSKVFRDEPRAGYNIF